MENKLLKVTLDELQDLRNEYLDGYQNNCIGYFFLDQKGTIIGVNKIGASMLGFEPENIINTNFIQFIGDDSQNIFNVILLKSLQNYEPQHCKIKFIKQKHNILYGDIKISTIFDNKENSKKVMVSLINITKHNNIENELNFNHKKIKKDAKGFSSIKERLKKKQIHTEEFARVLDIIPAAVWISHDNKGLWITGNRLSYEYLDIPWGSNVSKSLPLTERPKEYKLLKDDVELETAEMPVQKSSSGHELRNFEFDIVYQNNKVRHMMGNATPLFDENNNPRGSVSAFIDVTNSKNAEIKMEKLVKELRRSNKELKEFAYVTSHDLKEPLRMVSSFAQLLEKRYKNKLDQRCRRIY